MIALDEARCTPLGALLASQGPTCPHSRVAMMLVAMELARAHLQHSGEKSVGAMLTSTGPINMKAAVAFRALGKDRFDHLARYGLGEVVALAVIAAHLS